ncbi:winged helix-turn-helix transcriptional regulator [Haloquadratum walsbyi]|uniref:HoxA-like transcriptional regulator n=1 Tax=Haloquadratum walsbyi J07HQW2 TaxID=1238425 RepID=U1NJC7_9EURY|nr:winged helix-turn-helix transcriptional regulator [Haloquadratum walsbyi]ERG97038.1 MAG: HoxA-like transcriptional regulator [Haloquadratum walsbyi J07HQW2]
MSNKNTTELINDLISATDVFSKKWNAPVLYAVSVHSEASYTDISSVIPDITSKMLSGSLTDLQERDLIRYDEQTQQSVYKLTAEGQKFVQILELLVEWNIQYDSDETSALIIEDESMIAELYMNYLSEDYDPHYYESAKEALSSTIDEDIITILDRRLPNISGDEVAARLKTKVDTCLILAVSGVEPGEGITELPIDDYLQKPVKKDELLSRLSNLELRLGLPPEEQQYLAVRSKQRALRDAYGRSANSMSAYTALSKEADSIDVSSDRKDSLNELIER